MAKCGGLGSKLDPFLCHGVGRLPAAAQGAVKLDHAEEFVEPGLGQDQFGVEKFLLVVEDFQITGHAAFVADVRQSRRVPVRLGALFLPGAEFRVRW